MPHRGDMSKEGVQFLISLENAVLSKIIDRPDRPYALAPCLLVEGFGAAIRRHRHVVRPVRGHYPLRYLFFRYGICSGTPSRPARLGSLVMGWAGLLNLSRGGPVDRAEITGRASYGGIPAGTTRRTG